MLTTRKVNNIKKFKDEFITLEDKLKWSYEEYRYKSERKFYAKELFEIITIMYYQYPYLSNRR